MMLEESKPALQMISPSIVVVDAFFQQVLATVVVS
jgi:hypothetical protein